MHLFFSRSFFICRDALFTWRKEFFAVCKLHGVSPAIACVQFALHVPGVKSIALNTTEIKRVRENLEMANANIPIEFWQALNAKGLIRIDFLNRLQMVS